MIFLHPEFLYYMLPIVIILFSFLLTQKEAQANFFSDEVMSKLRVSANTLTLKARNALFFLIAVLIIIALSGPSIKDGKIEIKAKSADIMIALDISDSMLAQDVYPNRLKLAKQKALELLRLAPNERIGVIAFAKNSYLVSPLSFDHDAVHFLLSKLDTNSITEQGTDFDSMLNVVSKSIKNNSKKYLLLLSDGGDKKDFSKEIKFAKDNSIVIFVIGMGTKHGAPIKLSDGKFIQQNGNIIISKLNEQISALAMQTGGVYIKNVNSNQDIKQMLKEIEAHSKKKELKSKEIQRYIPLFYYPLGLALILLLVATSSMSKRVSVDVPAIFIAVLLIFNTTNSNAAIFDFLDIKKANEAYKQKDFKTAAKIYETHAKRSNDDSAYYDAGNAFYKMGDYKNAVKFYEQSYFSKPKQRAEKEANLGNAYAKQGDMKNLQNAVKAYERSLKLVEDKDVRENLEMVKKEIQKKKKHQQKNKKKQNKKHKKQKNKNKQDKNSDSKSKNKDQNRSKQNKQNKQKKDLKNNKPKQENKNDKAHKNKKLKKNRSKSNKKEKQNLSHKQKMSDAEEKKWLQRLNKNQNTFLYKLNTNQKNKENIDEKPW